MATNAYSKKTLNDLTYEAMRRLSQTTALKSGPTFRVASSDTAQTITSTYITDPEGFQAVRALVTVESNNVRIAFGGTVPTQGATPVGHVVSAGQTLIIDNPTDLATFRFINATASSNGVLQITPGY